MTLLSLELRKQRRALLGWALSLAAILCLFLAVFPSMATGPMQEMTRLKMQALPKEMLVAFGLKNIPDFTAMPQYFAYVFEYVVMAGAVYAALLGASSLSREEGEGTIEFLYAMPFSRLQIYAQKCVAALFIWLQFMVICFGISLGASLIFKDATTTLDDILGFLLPCMLSLAMVGLIFLATSFCIGSFLSGSRRVNVLALGLFFVTYCCGVAADLSPDLNILRYLSPTHIYLPLTVVREGFSLLNICIDIAWIDIMLFIGAVHYAKKDLRC